MAPFSQASSITPFLAEGLTIYQFQPTEARLMSEQRPSLVEY